MSSDSGKYEKSSKKSSSEDLQITCSVMENYEGYFNYA